MPLLENFSALLTLSLQMVEFAKRQEWESLTHAEQQRASIIKKISINYPEMTTKEITPLGGTIRQIQACEQEILEYVTPWREHVAKLLTQLESKQ